MSDANPDDNPVVLFDGVCNLCNGFVQFILPRDTNGRFRFASLQSNVGQELLAEHGLPTDELESVVLIEGDDCYTKSDAVIRIATLLGGVYALFGPFRVLPRRLRDWAYDFVAARRYRWFGKKDQCVMPPSDVSVGERFLE
ncbi:thiol-disulfide oxidoreductase DCC family protein [Natrinema hispanicum]|uniref:Predicted thiol-disulfide oxidoreductase YuxK, DCC family n=1 Tax=Natrinema hispanicum TaxID=392421 RepID=A0A1G6JRK1_9EURY|nr:thiol-disulfide oxidoreductase DCC family protein [Natrinema hispanicum]SDC21317.1 Predicted thiol-disulfide oxidoreductase YuxK, DCC family [Natrinema hispanicum]SES68955.1 Predicted thiol-disulfide oxidoreductase YuxK, DCC family [Natrinema hispanicum]